MKQESIKQKLDKIFGVPWAFGRHYRHPEIHGECILVCPVTGDDGRGIVKRQDGFGHAADSTTVAQEKYMYDHGVKRESLWHVYLEELIPV